MRKSDELIAVMKRIMGAIKDGDPSTIRGVIAPRPETLVVGNRGEWLYGNEALEVFVAQLSVVGSYDRTIHSIEAYEDGAIGWAAAKHTVSYPSGVSVEGRTTAVFFLSDGVWRVVQWHASSPIADFLTDVDVPQTLSDLVDSLDDDLDSRLADLFDTEQVALVISDIEDSTKHGVDLGDLVWTDVVNRHFENVRRITDVHRGTIVKTMGDGVLIAFDTAAEAASAAVEIQRSVADRTEVGQYRIKIGVHVGTAVHTDDDYFGYTVNKTARIASAAHGNEILVSAAAAAEINGFDEFILGDPRRLDLKGLPGTHIVHPVNYA